MALNWILNTFGRPKHKLRGGLNVKILKNFSIKFKISKSQKGSRPLWHQCAPAPALEAYKSQRHSVSSTWRKREEV